ncbi:MAG TPA: hypothetical protein VGL83_05705 [Stellaceae bacterium]
MAEVTPDAMPAVDAALIAESTAVPLLEQPESARAATKKISGGMQHDFAANS